jgi:hypothetical protein
VQIYAPDPAGKLWPCRLRRWWRQVYCAAGPVSPAVPIHVTAPRETAGVRRLVERLERWRYQVRTCYAQATAEA